MKLVKPVELTERELEAIETMHTMACDFFEQCTHNCDEEECPLSWFCANRRETPEALLNCFITEIYKQTIEC